jgi:osmotically-inducible protein OsmY
MGHKSAATNFPHSDRRHDDHGTASGYNTQGYYRSNRSLGDSRMQQDTRHDDADMYDELNTGKRENYNSDGYYGSNYGSMAELNRGRNYESNAGYRDNYDHLTTGQWPEIERAARSRGFDLHQYELEQRGVHRGKGPKGWQRSDQRMLEDINDLLTEDPYVDASEIDVQVEKGEVILSGTVENRGIKRKVEDLIEGVSGVKHVENRLRIRFDSGRAVNIRNSEE